MNRMKTNKHKTDDCMEQSPRYCVYTSLVLSSPFRLVVKSGTPQSGPEKILSDEEKKREYSHIHCSGTELRFAGWIIKRRKD